MWRHFEHVSVFKPHASRPANSERFIIAKGFKGSGAKVVEYLWSVNDRMNSFKAANGGSMFASGGLKQARVQRTGDVTRLLSAAAIELAAPFFEQMRAINNHFGERQLAELRKLQNFVLFPALPSENKCGIREDCLLEWRVPDRAVELLPEAMYDPDRCEYHHACSM